MELFVSYAIISSLFWASFSFVAKYILSKKMRNYISFIYLQGIIIIIIFPILSYLIVPDQIFLPPLEVAPYAIISGGTSILAYLLMYYGLTKYDASSASPIISTQSIFVIPLTYIFLNEYYGLIVILWILIAGLGAIMTSWDENINARQLFSFKNKAFWIFFIAAFLYALGNVAVKPALKIVSNFNFLIWREFAWFGVLLALMPLIFHKRERKRLREDWKDGIVFVILGILIQFFGYILMFYALGISVQITMGLSASNGFFAVIIGFFLSKTSLGILLEKHGSRIYLIRMIGALMILFSIYKLSFVL
ncbi:MAG: DMT family transporter [Candidatus Bathyarchaeota archaeon]|nr:DMT family transporter [Candidatus Bathyarchaeota archaeon]MCZ2846265.1 DMT family transporter [Candidatus Bathyarchaeota archaeon]